MTMMKITEREARLIVDGIQSGDLDEVDVMGIADHFPEWKAESWSYAARQMRGEED